MLSEEEKKEMLIDAQDRQRRDSFRFKGKNNSVTGSFDAYVSFLDGIQKIFSPFSIASRHTITKFNKL